MELNAIRWLKDSMRVLLKHTGAPPWVWLQAMKYLADIHNYTIDETLGYKIPMSIQHPGIIHDILPFLQFMFWEQVFYLDDDEKFPSTKAKPGYWVGICMHAGDHLTFNIIDVKTKEIVECSNVKSARISANPTSDVFTKIHDLEPNMEVETKEDKEPQPEPFPSVNQDDGSEMDSDDEDAQSVKSAPMMASIPIPV